MDLETQTKNPLQNPAPPIPPEQGSELTAFNIIRTETVLSKLPVHNLAKKGRVNIEIVKQGPTGEVELKWEVSYSDRYGQARQLAYKLDTIVVDHAIDEAGKPLPERLRLGSLREVAEQLSMGHNLAKVKRAFHQNAGAYIVAKFKYKANDGTEKLLEAGFHRYSIFFTGDTFKDGTKADAVYIEFQPSFREVLNNAPMRPLDLDYKRQLAPAPQRFYEIVSYKIFTALKYNQPAARLAYSEYCTFSAQQRYFTRAQVQKQMYKLHLPHKKSGYIESMEYQETTDQQGNPDWDMFYIPGPKARNDHAIATGKKVPRMIDGAVAQLPAGERTARSHRPRQRRLNLKPAPPATQQEAPPAQPAVIIDYRLIAELAKRGISETDARTILAILPSGQAVLDQLEWGDQQIAQSRGKITNPPGFYISLLQRNVTPPATFETSQARNARQQAEFARAEAIQMAQAAAESQEEAERQKLDELFAALPLQEQTDLDRQVKAELKARYPSVNWDDGTAVHAGTIRAGIRRLLQSRPVHPVPQSAPTVAEHQGAGETVAPVEQPAALPLTPLQLLTILTMLQLPAPKPAPATPEIPQN